MHNVRNAQNTIYVIKRLTCTNAEQRTCKETKKTRMVNDRGDWDAGMSEAEEDPSARVDKEQDEEGQREWTRRAEIQRQEARKLLESGESTKLKERAQLKKVKRWWVEGDRRSGRTSETRRR